jgi:hypothetical protein
VRREVRSTLTRRGGSCDHGIPGGCALCTKYVGQCDYADCVEDATHTAVMRTGQRRPVCPSCLRVLLVTQMAVPA